MKKAFHIIFFFLSVSAFAQKDTVLIEHWGLLEYKLNEEVFIDIDTSIYNVQRYHPFYKKSISVSHLGNIGLPAQSNIFIERPKEKDFIFKVANNAYEIAPWNVKYLVTNKPYTQIDYTGSNKPKEELSLRFYHAQSINPKLSFNFQYYMIDSEGKYDNQKSKNNSFCLGTAYRGARYKMHTNFILNNTKFAHNGGFDEENSRSTSVYETRMPGTESASAATTNLSNVSAYVVQSYLFGKYVDVLEGDSTKSVFNSYASINHSVHFERDYMLYNDELSDATNLNFYSGRGYYNEKETQDSVLFSKTRNIIDFKLKNDSLFKKLFALDAQLIHDYNHVYNFTDYIEPDFTNSYQDLSTRFSLYKNEGRFRYEGNMQYFLAGREQTSHIVDASLFTGVKLFSDSVDLTVRFTESNKKPSYFFEKYYSNRIRWNKELSPITKSQLYAQLQSQKLKLKLFFGTDLIHNYTYIGTDTVPVQHNKALSVITLGASHHLDFGNFNLKSIVIVQKTSENQDALNLPLLSAYESFYYEDLIINDVLFFQLGVDCYFNTKFKVPAYTPATNLFFNQTRQIGAYPRVDIFLNAILKQAILFVKLENITPYINDSEEIQYSALHYPIRELDFKFGVKWLFHN